LELREIVEEDKGPVPVLTMRAKAIMIGSFFIASMLIAAGIGIPRLSLALTGVYPGGEGIDLGFQIKVDTSNPSNLSLLISYTNNREKPLRVNLFHSLDSLFLDTPNGSYVYVMYPGNLSWVIKQVDMEPGQTLTETRYDVFELWWKEREGQGNLLPGRDVLEEAGEYRITAKYRPFSMDKDPVKKSIILTSSASFNLQSTPPLVEGRVDVRISDLWTRHIMKLVDYVNDTNKSRKIYTVIVFGNATNYGDPGWVTIQGYLDIPGQETLYGSDQRMYFYTGMSATIHTTLTYPVPRSRESNPLDKCTYGFQVIQPGPADSYICDDLSDDLRLTTHLVWKDSEPSLEVICTNIGNEIVNVTSFLPWGFTNPIISITDPEGKVFDAISFQNITPVVTSRPLNPGDNLSTTYDFEGYWAEEDKESPIPGNEIFSEEGKYTLNVRYLPFMHLDYHFTNDPDPGKAATVLTCEIRFISPTG